MAVLEGKPVAEIVHAEVQKKIAGLRPAAGRPPGLAVIIAGDDPASQSYVAAKEKTARKLGIESRVLRFPATVTRDELLVAVRGLNRDPAVDAVLVQLPVPAHVDSWEILEAMDPAKDVDRFHPFNQGLIQLNRADLFPCTPAGIMRVLDHYGIEVSGMNAAVVGRSFIVGKPMALMLSNRNATVTICHSRTRDLGALLSRMDLVVAAVGRAGFIASDWVRTGAVLIDVGINRVTTEEEFRRFASPAQEEAFRKKGSVLVGDIHPAATAKAAHYTPVPGGVGPMTVAMLMYNTVELFERRIAKN